MQAETQTQAITAPENAPQGKSAESKSKRGGKRPGAGRKPNLAKRYLKGLSREAIHEAVATMDVGGVILSLLKSKRERTRLETLVFVWDRLYGRPAQNMNVSGSMLHAHTIWRPLANLNLTEEELRVMKAVHQKMLPAVSNASPDAHQNQTESKPALEAEVVALDLASAEIE